MFLVTRAGEAAEYKNVAEETSAAAGSKRRKKKKKTRKERRTERRRSLGGKEERAGEGRSQGWRVRLLTPLALTPRSRSHTEPAGDCRVAINAVELTPGCPFAGKVRLKERRNGRQLPRNERETEGRREGGREGGRVEERGGG